MKNRITIKHQELDIEDGWTHFIIITEIQGNTPVATYRYEIPVEYQLYYKEYKELEKYYPLCPN